MFQAEAAVYLVGLTGHFISPLICISLFTNYVQNKEQFYGVNFQVLYPKTCSFKSVKLHAVRDLSLGLSLVKCPPPTLFPHCWRPCLCSQGPTSWCAA